MIVLSLLCDTGSRSEALTGFELTELKFRSPSAGTWDMSHRSQLGVITYTQENRVYSEIV